MSAAPKAADAGRNSAKNATGLGEKLESIAESIKDLQKDSKHLQTLQMKFADMESRLKTLKEENKALKDSVKASKACIKTLEGELMEHINECKTVAAEEVSNRGQAGQENPDYQKHLEQAKQIPNPTVTNLPAWPGDDIMPVDIAIQRIYLCFKWDLLDSELYNLDGIKEIIMGIKRDGLT
ncbi:hypothetical protein OE88DRAFT_1644322 [Heliocybe sulcata]|uniref:Uncharacterized protein n=1 Tax=Heliocybe sulcata TaxID=5364 RepID=A0A5C3N6D9_9AGAM|nr:hypothetical protein OE88DRAFT_1644322 [Heliocybe sulcata]